MELDDQRRSILSEAGHLLIEGGPGCGKTSIALVKASRALPALELEQKVLFLSFSRAAVRQVLDRAGGVLTHAQSERVEVRTFHSFFLEILRTHGRSLSGRSIQFISPAQELQLRAVHTGSDWAAEKLRLATREGLYVFDLLASGVADLFARSRATRSLYSDTYPIVIVDEFQDTNEDQWRVIEALAVESTVILLADPDQRIFDHIEGVVPERIPRAIAALSPIRFDLSAENFRSPIGGILDYANAVLRNRPIDEHSIPGVKHFNYASHIPVEYAAHAVTVSLRKELVDAGISAGTVAVLASTNGIVNRISDKILFAVPTSNGVLPPIPHDLQWDAALSAAAGVAVASLLEWPRLDRLPAICLTLSHMAGFYRAKYANGVLGAKGAAETLDRSVDALQRGARPAAKSAKILSAVYDNGYRLRGSPVIDWMKVRSLFSGSQELNEVGKAARFIKVGRASDSMAWALGDSWNGEDAYSLASSTVRSVLEEEVLQGRVEPPAPVTLMSMHKSKGREFDGVVMVEDRYQGVWLPERATPEKMSESRRLLRVAITRARHRVFIVRPSDAVGLID
ncbi:UvrD-helicase domain-containing protein [Blastococcus tunisiensis]|uniref:DNA 3'-5' helicase n=1 Tax=Blastococcus tunisiensis TaxID=1798228 RepID=A0A1I2I047_9ACTN|nr:ATP-dependent helicase [Blastococcus sp. DSM 46838]SFF34990.1 DNA helicase-2 / ATP-dependent DNA helicase PcrA [Blastococcus sp. DSM 46838]